MIHYEIENSPETKNSHFFIANKKYCEAIESKSKNINAEVTGWCNAFGYELETTILINKLSYNLKLHKNQSTQNGVILPVNALDYTGSEFSVAGLAKNFEVTIGKSGIKRLFTSKIFKEILPAPYFMKFNYSPDKKLLDDLKKQIPGMNVSHFNLSDGTLNCKILAEIKDPAHLISEFEKVIKNWE